MIKLADENVGSVSGWKVDKRLTPRTAFDWTRRWASRPRSWPRFGADPHEVFLGTVHAGHPGGMLPLTEASAPTLHDDRLPENVFVADAALFPRSLGNPPILTIHGAGQRVARICLGQFALATPITVVIQPSGRAMTECGARGALTG